MTREGVIGTWKCGVNLEKRWWEAIQKRGTRDVDEKGYVAEIGLLFTKSFTFSSLAQTTVSSLHRVKCGHLTKFWPVECG